MKSILNKIIILTSLLGQTTFSYAQGNNTPEYERSINEAKAKRGKLKRRKAQANGAHQAATFITQLAPWNIQTSIGFPLHIIAYGIEDYWNEDNIINGRFNFYTISQEEVFQLGIGRCKPTQGRKGCRDNYSLGAYHVSSAEQASLPPQGKRSNHALSHEMGHVQASSLMGPLYVPLVLLSYYVFEGYYQSMFEGWAELAADNKNMPLIRSYQLRLGLYGQSNTQNLNSAVSFQIQDSRIRENEAILEEKIWEFLHLSMNAPTNCPSCTYVPRLSLYRDKTRFQGRFQRHNDGFLNDREPVFQVHGSGNNTIGEYQNDGSGGHQVTSLGWSGRLGVMYVPTRAFKAYLGAGTAASITTSWNDSTSASTDLNAGYNAEIGMIIGDAVEIKALYEHLYGFLQGTHTKRKSATISTTPSGEERFRLHLSGGIQSQTVTDESGRVIFDSQTTGASIGGNF